MQDTAFKHVYRCNCKPYLMDPRSRRDGALFTAGEAPSGSPENVTSIYYLQISSLFLSCNVNLNAIKVVWTYRFLYSFETKHRNGAVIEDASNIPLSLHLKTSGYTYDTKKTWIGQNSFKSGFPQFVFIFNEFNITLFL